MFLPAVSGPFLDVEGVGIYQYQSQCELYFYTEELLLSATTVVQQSCTIFSVTTDAF